MKLKTKYAVGCGEGEEGEAGDGGEKGTRDGSADAQGDSEGGVRVSSERQEFAGGQGRNGRISEVTLVSGDDVCALGLLRGRGGNGIFIVDELKGAGGDQS